MKTNQASPANSSKNQEWYLGLKELKSTAILMLSDKLKIATRRLTGIQCLAKEEFQEFIQDIIILVIQKIKTEQYEFRNYSPICYAMVIARKLLSNRLRKRKSETIPLELQEYITIVADMQNMEFNESKDKLDSIIRQLDSNCEQLIRLKYFDELKDDEIIRSQLTSYKSVQTLKVRRCQCLCKLKSICKSNGLSISHFR